MRLPVGVRKALVDDPTALRQLVEAALNRFLDAEIGEHLQAYPCGRSERRTRRRNVPGTVSAAPYGLRLIKQR